MHGHSLALCARRDLSGPSKGRVPWIASPTLPAWWAVGALKSSSASLYHTRHKTSFAGNKHGPIHYSISFLPTKAQKSVTGVTMKKRQNFLKKNLGRKGKEAKSLQVAGGVFKGLVLDALGKCILLIKK